jgi:hypothetical protein
MTTLQHALRRLPSLRDVYSEDRRVSDTEFKTYYALYCETVARCRKYGSKLTLPAATASQAAVSYGEDRRYLPGYIRYLDTVDVTCDRLKSLGEDPVLHRVFSFREYKTFVKQDCARGVLDDTETDPT